MCKWLKITYLTKSIIIFNDLSQGRGSLLNNHLRKCCSKCSSKLSLKSQKILVTTIYSYLCNCLCCRTKKGFILHRQVKHNTHYEG